MDPSIPKLTALPLASNELRPQPRGDRSRNRGRFVVDEEEREGSRDASSTESARTSDLPIARHEADEAGSHLDLTA
jgi:hypothetical protein